MKIIDGIRKNIGTIIAGFGFLLLCIITFGDLAEIITEEYWKNVLGNLTSIGMITVALTMIQVSIKQGVAEQALQRGLNTPAATAKWEEHKTCIKENTSRLIYMPYFLQIHNERQTILQKREFLINNNFTSEKALLLSKRKRLIRKYNSIRIYLTVSRIKWATTDIVYNKHGQIITLQEYRTKRLFRGILLGLIFMVGMTLLTTGLFLSKSEVEVWKKFIKLGTYVLTISLSVIYSVIKNYEKGAFGVPNELDELNCIWNEFKMWQTPDWVLAEVENLNHQPKEITRGKEIKSKTADNSGTDIQDKPVESKVVQSISSDNVVPVSESGSTILDFISIKKSGEPERSSSDVK